MTNVMACRMCLAVDKPLYPIANTPFQEIYEKITGKILNNEEGMPTMACYTCRHLLRKTQNFINMSIRADKLLKEILGTGLQITQKEISLIDKDSLRPVLSTTQVYHLNVEIDTQRVYEVPVKKEICLKEEIDADEYSKCGVDTKEIEIDFNVPESEPEDTSHPQDNSIADSEDDMPLNALSTKSMNKANMRKQNVEESKKLLTNVSEIYLTKEEQIAEVMARAKSLNYLNSPFKCGQCYKGFVDARAFENHNEKHDERSGAHACDVCRLRYRSERLLRTHALTAHARRFLCHQCAHRSHTKNQAKEHEKWHNGHTYECQLCSHVFRKPTSYLSHMRKRHASTHVCSECGLCFVSRHGLLMHRTKAHNSHQKEVSEPSQACTCVECDIQFKSAEAWQRHILTSVKHAPGNGSSANVQCALCTMRTSGALLRAHVRTHSGPRAPRPTRLVRPPPQQPCDQCGVKFATRSRLAAHVRRTHLGLKYRRHMVCELCGKDCPSNAALKYHQRTHTGERPYPCTLCTKRFADRNQLRIHTRTHSGERPYCCSACGKRFAQKPALNRHCRIHTGAKPYACQFCPKTFSQSNSLKLHVNAVHLKLPQNKKKTTTDQPPDL